MKSIIKYSKYLYVALFVATMQLTFVSCDDDPGVENYYTSTSEYAL